MKILMADGTEFIDYLKDNGVDKKRLMTDWGNGYETCKSNLAQFLMPQLEQLAQEEIYKADVELYESKLKMANEKIAELEGKLQVSLNSIEFYSDPYNLSDE